MQIQAVCLPAPSEAAEQHAASYTHPHSCRVQRTWMVEPSQQVLSALAFACIWSWNFPSDTLIGSICLSLPSFPAALSPPPAHLCVVFLAPIPFPSLFSLTRFPPVLSYVLRGRLVRRTEWHAADAGWGPCLLQGPLTKTKLHVCWRTWTQLPEEATTITFFTLFFFINQLKFSRENRKQQWGSSCVNWLPSLFS